MHRILPILAAIVTTSIAFTDSIELRRSVRLGEGASGVIMLRDIALLEGDFAVQLGELRIADAPAADKALEISIDEVRQHLDEAGANWGKINLTGKSVIIRPRLNPGVELPTTMTAASLPGADLRKRDDHSNGSGPGAPPADSAVSATAYVTERTIRGLIASMIVDGLQTDPARVRLTFDQTDAEALAISTETGRFQVDPGSSWLSDRVELTVHRWDGASIGANWRIGARVQLRVDVAKATKDIRRQAVIGPDDISVSPQWIAPSESRLLAANVAGMHASRNIDKDEVIRSRDIRGEVLIRKGDHVKVRKMVGVCVISMDAEAVDDAAAGETVMLCRIGLRGRRDRTSFPATVTGPGEAILADDPALASVH